MIIVIRKEPNNKFLAFVADPKSTFVSGYEIEFEPFRNGIVAEGQTWGEALENIKHQVDKYREVHIKAMNEEPEFIKNGQVTIITEGAVFEDFLK